MEIKETDAAGSAIRFQHADFQPELAEYATQRDPLTSGVTHLASFHGPDSSAMLIASLAGPGYVFEERSTEAWVSPLLPEAKIIWGARGRARSGIGYIPYRLFEIDGQPVSCAGFTQTVGETRDDRLRKRNLVFGYFCRDESRPMTSQYVEELLGQVKLGRGG
jgi:hypothetical protein